MESVGNIILGKETIGTVKFHKEGLYYRFQCRCKLTGEVVFKIIASNENKSVNLGICVPKDGAFGLETKIPIKQLGEGSICFFAVPKHADLTERFVPIKPDEPFAYIERLQKCHLARQGDTFGILLTGD